MEKIGCISVSADTKAIRESEAFKHIVSALLLMEQAILTGSIQSTPITTRDKSIDIDWELVRHISERSKDIECTVSYGHLDVLYLLARVIFKYSEELKPLEIRVLANKDGITSLYRVIPERKHGRR